jgi:dihydrofolate reductase
MGLFFCFLKENSLIYMITAMSEGNIIGKDNKLLWHISEDLKHFKSITSGKTIIMGKNTYNSIMEYTEGKPLPYRDNIVLTNNPEEKDGFRYMNKSEVLSLANKQDIYIIGGAQVYQEFINYADVLYITEVFAKFDGDSFFPEIDKNRWVERKRINNQQEDLKFDFVTYSKFYC